MKGLHIRDLHLDVWSQNLKYRSYVGIAANLISWGLKVYTGYEIPFLMNAAPSIRELDLWIKPREISLPLADLATTHFPIDSALEEIRISGRVPFYPNDKVDPWLILADLLIRSSPNLKCFQISMIGMANLAHPENTERFCSALEMLKPEIEGLQLWIPDISLNVPYFTKFISTFIEEASNLVFLHIQNREMKVDGEFDRVVQLRPRRNPDLVIIAD